MSVVSKETNENHRWTKCCEYLYLNALFKIERNQFI
jgi:hypothetical protein